jgi:nicotinamidase-related amidase
LNTYNGRRYLNPQPAAALPPLGGLNGRAKTRRDDAFLGTDLEMLLRNRGIENLLVAGGCTDICVPLTVQHARNLDFRCYVLRDCIAGTSVERHEAALLCLSHVVG